MTPTDKLPHFFLSNVLKIDVENHPMVKDAAFLLGMAMAPSTTGRGIVRFNRICSEMAPDKAAELRTAFHEALQNERESILKQHAARQPEEAKESEEVPDYQNPSATRRRVEEDDDLAVRKRLRYMSSAKEKVDCLLSIAKAREQQRRKLTSGASSFVKRCLNPTVACLNKHFGGSVENFLAKWPDYQHTTFLDKCCNGKGETCAPK
jgi:hypothetical protein